MSRPGSHTQAFSQAYNLLANSLRGTPKNQLRRAKMAGQIAEKIWLRWQVGIWQWRLKHLHWYFDVHMARFTPSTRYNHWGPARDVLYCLGNDAMVELLKNRKNATYSFKDGVVRERVEGRPENAPKRAPKNTISKPSRGRE